MRPADLSIRPALRLAFATAWDRPLPAVIPLYTPTIRALRDLERSGLIRSWLRLHRRQGSEHHLRLLATYLSAPSEARGTWMVEHDILDSWFNHRGIRGRARVRAARPRVPDAAFCESGRWIALEVHNEDRGAPERHPDVLAKRAAVQPGCGHPDLLYPGWFDEFRLVTLSGIVLRFHLDGRVERILPAPGPHRAPDGCRAHFCWDTPRPPRAFGTAVEAGDPSARFPEEGWDYEHDG